MNRPGHGPNDFEDRLRAALRRRAEEVAPDPGMWVRVKERAARRRRSRWLGAAATVTPLLAAVAVSVALGLPGREPGMDLAELGPVATPTSSTLQAAPATTPTTTSPPPGRSSETPLVAETLTAAPQATPSGGDPQDRVLVLATAPGLVVTDANAEPVDVVVTEPAAECVDVAGCEAEVVSDVHARPGSSATDLTITFLESFEPCMGAAGYAIRTYGAEATTDAGGIAVPGDPCPAAPIWSPDGSRLAWLERGGPSARLELVTVAWQGDPVAAASPAPVSRTPIPGDLSLGLEVPKIVEWVTDATGAPVLYVTGGAFGEEPVLHRLPLAADPAGVAPSGPLTPVTSGGDGSRYLTYASAGDPGPAYLIDRAERGQDGRPALELVVSAAGDGSEAVPPAPVLDLPVELVDPSAPDGGRVWLRARGGEVLLGDGFDDAWRTRWDGTAWGPLEELPGAIRSADFLDLPGS